MPPTITRPDFLALFDRERADVTIADGHISIHLGSADPYQVSLANIQCERDILERVTHLFECTRVDAVTIRTFIHHAHGHLRRLRAATAPLGEPAAVMLANN